MRLVSIDEVDIKEKRVFIRVDFNVPVTKGGEILDDTRIRAVIPTIEYAIKERAKVIVASHLGRPMGKVNPRFSLEPVGRKLSEILDREIFFPEDCVGDAVKKLASDLLPGSVMLLENLRFHRGEEENDPRFAKRLASIADVYVNEAFSVSHRVHSSVVGILEFVQTVCVGFNFKKEIENLSRLLKDPPRPFVAIFGGRNASEKIPVMESLLDRVDTILVGGAVANAFIKALGGEVGRSFFDPIALYSAMKLVSSADVRKVRLVLPEDVVLIKGDLNTYAYSFTGSVKTIPGDAMVVDIGPKTVEDFSCRVLKAKTVFWNGPLGIYEKGDFGRGTIRVAEAVAASGAFSVVTGWDTISALKRVGLSSGITHISMGGQASLEFLQGKKLPAIEALEKRFK
jgi:phosphoglycerate kinase